MALKSGIRIAAVAALLGAGIIGAVLGATSASSQATPAAAVQSRAKTLEDFATKLTDRYVFPETGQKYAAMLRSAAASGKYDALTDNAAFAKKVTEDLQSVAFDGHLKIFPKPAAVAGAASGGGTGPETKTIEAQARLTDRIAYLRLGNFFGEPEAIAEAKKFLADNFDAEAIILDVRTHIGGGLAEMDAMFPYLFDKETVLLAMDNRSSVDSPIEDGPRLRRVSSPASVVRREHFVVPAEGPHPLAKAKIYVLSSGRTGSAGEHFVMALKRTGRATVIGETTYGAGNFGDFVSIDGGFSSFIASGRTFDPDTGKGWDYVGVAPNIAVPAAEALTEALVRSGVSRAEAVRLSAKYGPAPEDVTSKRKAPASVVGI